MVREQCVAGICLVALGETFIRCELEPNHLGQHTAYRTALPTEDVTDKTIKVLDTKKVFYQELKWDNSQE